MSLRSRRAASSRFRFSIRIETVFRYAKAVTIKNNPGLTAEQQNAAAKMMSQKRTAVVIKPEKIVSWDHRKLGGRY